MLKIDKWMLMPMWINEKMKIFCKNKNKIKGSKKMVRDIMFIKTRSRLFPKMNRIQIKKRK